MARYKPKSKKIKLIKKQAQTRWAPFWTVPRIYGRTVHPGRHTAIKRSWRRIKTKV